MSESMFDFHRRAEVAGAPLLCILSGPADAGAVPALIASSLLNHPRTEILGSFDSDRLFDYRSRRGITNMKGNRLVEAALPAVALYECHDGQAPFFLLHGPEPDLAWIGFVTSLIDTLSALQVTKVVSVQSLPWAAPHTRPVGVFCYGDDAYLNARFPHPTSDITFPSSITSVLEVQLNSKGTPYCGVVAKIPQYISGVEYAPALSAVANAVEAAIGIRIPVPLEEVFEVNERLTEHMRSFPPLAALVESLEESYDGDTLGSQTSAPLPSGDDIAAQIQDYLSER